MMKSIQTFTRDRFESRDEKNNHKINYSMGLFTVIVRICFRSAYTTNFYSTKKERRRRREWKRLTTATITSSRSSVSKWDWDEWKKEGRSGGWMDGRTNERMNGRTRGEMIERIWENNNNARQIQINTHTCTNTTKRFMNTLCACM